MVFHRHQKRSRTDFFCFIHNIQKVLSMIRYDHQQSINLQKQHFCVHTVPNTHAPLHTTLMKMVVIIVFCCLLLKGRLEIDSIPGKQTMTPKRIGKMASTLFYSKRQKKLCNPEKIYVCPLRSNHTY